MGSMLTEPDDLSAFFSGGGGGAGRTLKNITKICASAHRIHSTGVFTGANPLEFSVPLLLLQVGICAGTTLFSYQLLKPFGQPLIVSQILVTSVFLSFFLFLQFDYPFEFEFLNCFIVCVMIFIRVVSF